MHTQSATPIAAFSGDDEEMASLYFDQSSQALFRILSSNAARLALAPSPMEMTICL